MTTRATFAFALAGLLLGLPPVEGQAPPAPDAHAQDFYPPWAATARFNTPLSVRDTDGALGRLSLQPKELPAAGLDREAMAETFMRRLLDSAADTVVEVEELKGFVLPAQGPDLVAPRSDVVNRDLPRAIIRVITK